MTHALSDANWHKSSYSNGSGDNCVEHAQLSTGAHAVRDTKDRELGAFIVGPTAWQAFVDNAKLAPAV
ncbi:DUF397 domain-containing protein [Streptomyces sp. NPDC088252]|uniref:DUF397 domain-containing protein n=1 Tax=Streptomyces sp. NPDC088252 TaxID=3365845 RepID=UPI003823E3CD